MGGVFIPPLLVGMDVVFLSISFAISDSHYPELALDSLPTLSVVLFFNFFPINPIYS